MPFRLSHIWFLIFSIFHITLSQPSNHGLPFCSNFSKADYRGGTQNHDFAQDSQGRIYVANNDGLLMFNGDQWVIYPLPNRTIVRSVEIDHSGRIIVGGQDELGYFQPDENGHLTYTSLLELLPEDLQGIEDVWSIEAEGDTIWFMGRKIIGRISLEGVQTFEPEKTFTQLTIIDGQKYVVEQGKGILTFQDNIWTLLPGSEVLQDKVVTGIVKASEGLWISTAKSGMWALSRSSCRPLAINIPDNLIEFRAQTMIALSDQRIAIGTASEGIIILDTKANPICWLHKGNSISNNYILALFEDRDRNLWTGMENGIGYIELCSPFHQIIIDPERESSGYSMSGTDKDWWFGTSTGLYRIPAETYANPMTAPSALKPVTDGQIWGLRHLEDELFIAHHEGGFTGTDGIQNFSNQEGFWWYVPVPGHPGIIAAGTYSGMQLLRKEGGTWTTIRRIEGLDESCRLLTTDEERIWMAHPYRGIFSVEVGQDLETVSIRRYGKKDGLPDDLYNHVFSLFDKVYFGTIDGVYRFDQETSTFSRDEEIMKAIGKDGWVKLMREDQYGNIWFVMEEGVGYLKVDDSGLKRSVSSQWLPEVDTRIVKGHEFVYPYDEHHIFFGTDNGFLRFDPNMESCASHIPQAVFSEIRSKGRSDSLLISSFANPADLKAFTRELQHSEQNLVFEFAATSYRQADRPVFRYYLEGLEDDWSGWTTSREKEYTQLDPGTYSFHLQAKNSRNIESEPVTFTFTIRPPWYAGRTAKIVYLLIGILILAGIFLIPQRRFQEERQKLETDLKIHKEESEKQVTELKNQTLQAEITHKNQELATATMHLVQKNELLNSLKQELDKLKDKARDPEVKTKLRALSRQMSQEERFDKDWEQFAYHFDQVHSDFLKRLQEKFPQLTPKDHRLCAYLRLNLSSKEIAPMMNISVRGVEIGRYRLRKKLELSKDQNLNEFMMRF